VLTEDNKIYEFIYDVLKDICYSAVSVGCPIHASFMEATFSHAFAMSFTCDSIASIDHLESIGKFLDMAIEIQRKLLSVEGILTRGGITIGELFHDDNFLFGPAMVDADELESQSNYPRITVSKSFERNIELIEPKPREWISHFFGTDSHDDRRYLRYLENIDCSVKSTSMIRRTRELCHSLIKKFPNYCCEYNWVLSKLDFREIAKPISLIGKI
jgi:hypothetical protein